MESHEIFALLALYAAFVAAFLAGYAFALAQNILSGLEKLGRDLAD